jgi:predicted acyltransferase
MSGHLYQGTWDPEGILSTLPAIGTSLLGIFAGEWLLSGRAPGSLTKGMLVAAPVLILAGLAWGMVFPINKNLWTSSYVVFTAGMALLLFGVFHWVVDVRGRRGPWLTPLLIYGTNSIAVFFLSGLMTRMLGRIHVGGSEGPSLYGWLFRNVFQSWAGDYNGSLAFAASYVLLWLALMTPLYRRRIFIKV